LVVAALAFALAMQGHWHNYVSGKTDWFALDKFRKASREPNSQRLDLLEFQQQNCVDKGAGIDSEAAGAFEGIGFVLAGRA